MNHWKETAEILTRLDGLARAGQRAALATVVAIAGSAYRRPGAKLLIESAGTLGSVSGGCLEADVREVAVRVLATGAPSLRRYDTGEGDVLWGLGLGCDGRVDVFVQPATEGPLALLAGRLLHLLDGGEAFAAVTLVAIAGVRQERGAASCSLGGGSAEEAGEGEVHDAASSSQGGAWAPEPGAMLLVEPEGRTAGSLGDAELDREAAAEARRLLTAGRSEVCQVAERSLFVEVLAPPPHLVVCGAGEDAKPLVAYAADAGFRVTLFDHRPGLLVREAFPGAARLVLARPEQVRPGPPLAGSLDRPGLAPYAAGPAAPGERPADPAGFAVSDRPARSDSAAGPTELDGPSISAVRGGPAGPDLLAGSAGSDTAAGSDSANRDDRPEGDAISFPPAARSLAVVKTHSLAHDREWVRRLLAAGFPYIGVLGPRARTESILREVVPGGSDETAAPAARALDGARVFGPVGLDLGADGPYQVALSIVAELLAFVSGRQPRHLYERRGGIHGG